MKQLYAYFLYEVIKKDKRDNGMANDSIQANLKPATVERIAKIADKPVTRGIDKMINKCIDELEKRNCSETEMKVESESDVK